MSMTSGLTLEEIKRIKKTLQENLIHYEVHGGLVRYWITMDDTKKLLREYRIILVEHDEIQEQWEKKFSEQDAYYNKIISELQYEVDQLKRELNFEKHCRTACQEIRKWPIWKQLSLGIEPVIIPPVLERLLNEKKQLADEVKSLEDKLYEMINEQNSQYTIEESGDDPNSSG